MDFIKALLRAAKAWQTPPPPSEGGYRGPASPTVEIKANGCAGWSGLHLGPTSRPALYVRLRRDRRQRRHSVHSFGADEGCKNAQPRRAAPSVGRCVVGLPAVSAPRDTAAEAGIEYFLFAT